MKYTMTQDFSVLHTKPYYDAYSAQFKIHQDYFHHPEFQFACLSVFAKTSECFLFSAFKGEKLIGYMAFRTEIKKLRFIKYPFLVPVAENVAEYHYPVIDRQYTVPVLQFLDEALKDYNVYFPQMPGYFQHLISLHIKQSFVRYTMGNPLLIGADEMLAASNKRTLKKNKRQLERKHTMKVEHLSENIPDDLLDTFFAIHIERWEREGINSFFKQERYKEIYRKLAKLSIEGQGHSLLSVFSVDDQVLSMDFGFLFKDHYLVQIAATKQNEITSSAGSLLNKESLEYMGNKGLRVFDLGVGVEPYKLRYINYINTYFTVVKFKSKWHSLLQRICLKK